MKKPRPLQRDFTIAVDPVLMVWVAKEADRQGVSRSEVLEAAVTHYKKLMSKKGQERLAEGYRKFRAA